MTNEGTTPMTTDNGRTLTCWKEIAAHLGKGIRTVQRWERELGLPVHRPNAHNKGIVRASREELDQWMKTHWSRRATTGNRPDPAILPSGSTAKISANLKELRASNRELLKEFKESLRLLKTSCKELHDAVYQKDKSKERESTAA